MQIGKETYEKDNQRFIDLKVGKGTFSISLAPHEEQYTMKNIKSYIGLYAALYEMAIKSTIKGAKHVIRAIKYSPE